jgi:hypothetical protein
MTFGLSPREFCNNAPVISSASSITIRFFPKTDFRLVGFLGQTRKDFSDKK